MKIAVGVLIGLLLGAYGTWSQQESGTVMSIGPESSCIDKYGRNGTWLFDGTTDTLGCSIPDGKPPRMIHAWTTGNQWECDSGFVLDGFWVTWENGEANISPERCKAADKP